MGYTTGTYVLSTSRRSLVLLAWLSVALLAGLFIARQPLLSAALWTLLGLAALATLIEPLAGLLSALFLGLLWAYLRAEVPQVPAHLDQVFVVLTLGVWLARGLVRRQIDLPRSPLLLPVLIFLLAALLSLWDAVELPVYGVPELIKWLQIALLFLFVAQHAQPRHLPWLVGALLLIGLFQAGIGVWQFALRGTGPEHFAILGGRFYRAYGTFEQPNPYGGYVGMVLVLSVGVVAGVVGRLGTRGQASSSERFFYLLVCLLPLPLAAALLMSWSRGAWMGFGAALLAMAAAWPRRAHRGVLLVAALIMLGLALYVAGLLPPSVTARLTDFTEYVRFQDVRGAGINDANYAVLERMAHWQAALEMWRANFWTGVGFGDYEPAYRAFALLNWPIALGHAHNYYLNIAAETGLIGMLAYLGLWTAVFWQCWRAVRRTAGWQRGLALGLLGAFTQLTVHHLFDNIYVNNVHILVGTLLGLLSVLVRPTGIPNPADCRPMEGSV